MEHAFDMRNTADWISLNCETSWLRISATASSDSLHMQANCLVLARRTQNSQQNVKMCTHTVACKYGIFMHTAI